MAGCILPNFVASVGGYDSTDITNVKFSDWNWWEDGPVTTGTITLRVPTNMAGEAMDVNINGYKVGTVTVNDRYVGGRKDGYNVTVKNVR